MWRPCVWPPEHEDNSINCEGGKLVAYVYHMFKQHWCGDDFEYSNELFAREYSTNREPVIPKDFFQPKPDEWYTIWSHVKMNSAGQTAQLRHTQTDYPPTLQITDTDIRMQVHLMHQSNLKKMACYRLGWKLLAWHHCL